MLRCESITGNDGTEKPQRFRFTKQSPLQPQGDESLEPTSDTDFQNDITAVSPINTTPWPVHTTHHYLTNFPRLIDTTPLFTHEDQILRKGITFDVIIIPSGGINPRGLPNTPVQCRLDSAAKLSHLTRYYLSTGAYTPLKPVTLNAIGQPITEARADANYLSKTHDIHQSKIILEEMSKDTLGNAFFCKVLCEILHFSSVLVVTSKFHMQRARCFYDWVFRLIPHKNIKLHYLETVDSGLTPNDVEARHIKEMKSLHHFFENVQPKVSCMEDLAQFIYLGHRAYSFDTSVGRYIVDIPLNAFSSY